MPDYKFTGYFENEVLRKRPYIKKEWCIRIVEKPIKAEPVHVSIVVAFKLFF